MLIETYAESVKILPGGERGIHLTYAQQLYNKNTNPNGEIRTYKQSLERLPAPTPPEQED